MSAPHRTVTIPTTTLESIEDRLYFLAEVLRRDPGLEDHHVQGLATILGDIADDVLRIHDPEPFMDRRLAEQQWVPNGSTHGTRRRQEQKEGRA